MKIALNTVRLSSLLALTLSAVVPACEVGHAPEEGEEVGEAGQAAVLAPQGTALHFDGIDQVIIDTADGAIPESGYTGEMWFKTTDTDGGTLLEIQDSLGTTGDRTIYMNPNGTICAYVQGASPDLCTTTAYNDGVWHHVHHAISATLGTKLSVDTDKKAEAPAVTASTFTGDQRVVIGAASSHGHFTGDIDEVRVWNIFRTLFNVRGGAFREHPSNGNLAVYVRGNQAEGGLIDISPYANPVVGAPVGDGPTFVASGAPIYQQAMSFDGTGYLKLYKSLHIEAPSSPPTLGSFTLETWVKPANNQAMNILDDQGRIVVRLTPSGNQMAVFFFFYTQQGYYNIVTLASNGNSGNPDLLVPVNEWTHLALRYDMDSQRTDVIKHDTQGNKTVWSVNGVGGMIGDGVTSSNDTYVGVFIEGVTPYYPFTGMIDEMRFRDFALSDTDLDSRWNRQTGSADDTYLLMLHMNGLEPSTGREPDSMSGTKSDGVLMKLTGGAFPTYSTDSAPLND